MKLSLSRYRIGLILGAGVLLVLAALDWSPVRALGRLVLPARAPARQYARWGNRPAAAPAAEAALYLELVEENSDDFPDQLFELNPKLPPTPFYLDQEQILQLYPSRLQASRPENRTYVEAGPSSGRTIFLSYGAFYSGVGRFLEQPAYYVLNEPSGLVELPAYAELGPIDLPADVSPTELLKVRLLPGKTFAILPPGVDGSLRFRLDEQTYELRPGESAALGTRTLQAPVSLRTPYGDMLAYPAVTFTTTLTLYHHGAPAGVVAHPDGAGGE